MLMFFVLAGACFLSFEIIRKYLPIKGTFSKLAYLACAMFIGFLVPFLTYMFLELIGISFEVMAALQQVLILTILMGLYGWSKVPRSIPPAN